MQKMDPMTHTHHWWQRGVLYQVYPRSFLDSNGDGVGDLRGLIARLDYLAWLGIDAIWLSPFFPSPMADFGYDIADYTNIDPTFGTLADFDLLVAEAHRRNLRVILDYVPNHSSDLHPWFIDSRSSRTSARRDWYIWRDPTPDGGPPTNWLSEFSGSAWTLDPTTGQYYYHAYLPQQPDLNWRNPEVQEAMFDVMRFWLDHGVDGFRIDALRQLIKDDQFRDNPPNPHYREGMNPARAVLGLFTADLPDVQQITRRMRQISDSYGNDRVLIGELYLPIERLVTYYEAGIQLPFNFHLLKSPWDARAIAVLADAYEAALPPDSWPNWVLSNHDNARLASRIGPQQARVAAMLLLTLRGTPTLYYGDEIGMQNVHIPPELVQDPWEKRAPGLGLGRDPVRTPMQWDPSPGGGFTTGQPWLPLAADYETVNVAAQQADPYSLLNLYRRLIALRCGKPSLAVGNFTPIPTTGSLLAYEREHSGERALIVLNFSPEPVRLAYDGLRGRVALATGLDRYNELVEGGVELCANEGLIVMLNT